MTVFHSDMTIIVDTREKWTQKSYSDTHISDYFKAHNIDYIVQKLDEGDYQLQGNDALTIDRKKDMTEMYSCLVNDKSRFMREVRRCYDKQKKLYVLIEHGGSIKSISDVACWSPKYGSLNGRQIMDRMYSLHMAYYVEFAFCDKRSTGRRIIEILTSKKS